MPPRAHPSGGPRRAPRPGRVVRRRRALAGLLTVCVVLGITLGVAWWRLDSNITRIDLHGALAAAPPAAATGPMDILVIGSDTRVGQDTPDAASVSGARSDTTLVVHLSADRQRVTVVSVPRDSMIPMPPGCDASVPRRQWTVQQENSAFSMGGPACLVRTLRGDTGLRLDHVAVVDFRGFARMVDALGGVPVCTTTAIDDPKAHLVLARGRHVLDGTQALGYVRARYAEGDGSDLGRIGRQQAFLASVVQEATRTSLLLRPDRLYAFLDAATRSLSTDRGLGLGEMRDIATSLQHVGLGRIAFVTVPTTTYPADPNRVQWTPAASRLWRTLREDGTVRPSPSPSAPASSPTTSGAAAPPASASPSPSGTASSAPTPSAGSRRPSDTIEARTADQDICS
ncbi:LCP family protein [Phycicoccus flavus]|uniref:LCP family protein n=1 Tax=Phycicoccus flavus TaxID=2502783 RepID=A0A8T6R984_9MICO|nr:LCP family protein [Phycicoccus flavus]NHA69960.1 LCP family protein [Phycicoccus flavus]